MSQEIAKVEIVEPVVETVEKPSIIELKDQGLNAKETELAKKHGLIREEEKKEEPKKAVEEKEIKEAKIETDSEDDVPKDYEKFTPNEKGLYWARKKERTRRLRAEIEKEHVQIRLKALERELEESKKKTSLTEKKSDELNFDDLLSDEASETNDKKPLTRGDLDRIEKEKAEKEREVSEKRLEQAEGLKLRLKEFEVEAQEQYEDFDEVAQFASDILKNGQNIFSGDEERAELAQFRAERALSAMANALSWKDGQKTPAEFVYELGRLHPMYKSGAKKNAEKEIAPEKMERMIANSEKRSSASIAGGNGSRRVVSESELTLADASKLSQEQYAKLSKATRDRLLRM